LAARKKASFFRAASVNTRASSKKPAKSTVLRQLSEIEPVARLFWCWLQSKMRLEKLISFDDVLIDSTSIEVVLYARVEESAVGRFPDCNIGWKTTEKRYYFGQKLHLGVMPSGVALSFRLTPASCSDHKGFAKLNKTKIKSVTGDSGYKGDKGFAGQKIALTKPWGQSLKQRMLNGKRVRIEQVFNVLKELGLEGRLVLKNSRSLGSHLLSVLTCFLAIQYRNLKDGLSPLRYARFKL